MAPRTALLADSDPAFRWRLKAAAQNVGVIAEVCATADDARKALLHSPPVLFFSNLRLGMLRGIDLVHLARLASPKTRAVLYGRTADLLLAREAQAAGALFEPLTHLPYAIGQYVKSALPASDRRDAARQERRTIFRGGRRVTDIGDLRPAQ